MSFLLFFYSHYVAFPKLHFFFSHLHPIWLPTFMLLTQWIWMLIGKDNDSDRLNFLRLSFDLRKGDDIASQSFQLYMQFHRISFAFQWCNTLSKWATAPKFKALRIWLAKYKVTHTPFFSPVHVALLSFSLTTALARVLFEFAILVVFVAFFSHSV